ncbi:Wzz/FepE/Etk N-terminal domain-containing protein [Priestia megaterium]|uniref:YveK family protein n=1 Tax=Priestia megaterium TaxID=1404 RepID=UPI00244670BA|nr:Wzz/FepE/Etk N-terminal domain-containing protein [Priestia megaterium]WRQ93718.1 Wzz/FepE/Etk N-terminal domain-containing protein [Priestia megaterium]
MGETMSLKGLFQTLKKRVWLIMLITIIAAILSAVVSFFVITPIYEAKTQILVNQTKSDDQLYNSTEVQTNIQLINTYNVIIKSPAILDKVKSELNLKRSVEDLNSQITVSSATNSQVVEIVVQDSSPHVAAQIANETAKVFQTQISKIMKVNNVSVLSKAIVKKDVSPIKPQPLMNIVVAIIVGLIVGGVVAFLIEHLDNTVKTEQDIENILELPVMGVIVNIKEVPKVTSVGARPSLNSRAPQRGETYGS